jgi:tRNA(Met) cytidine acetyltransferase
MTTSRPSYLQLALELQASAHRHRHRRLLLLCGEATSCRRQASHLLEVLGCKASLWVGTQPPKGINARLNNQALEHLGEELDLLIYDSFSGFNADAFGALSGTLRGGGLLLLLTPRLSEWPDYPDPEYVRLVVAGQPASDFGGAFIHRLVRQLQADPWTASIEDGEIVSRPAAVTTEPQTAPSHIEGCLSPDQHRAVKAIEQVVHGHRKRPLVLSSDRGRGKSSALGIAAARLMLERERRILVTAPRRSAVEALFQQVRQRLPDARAQNGELHAGGSCLVYSAPDHLIAHPQAADLLLVDEAAAIPTALLQAMLENYARLVFATTIHGYEGTGRGFALRFRGCLDRLCPQWRGLRLETPIRWAPDDPLEALVFRLLGLDCEPAADEKVLEARPQTSELLIPDRHWLQQHETALRQLFGLLVLAHYRTRPQDLRLLLDAPNLQTLLLRQGEQIVGAALVAIEGGLDEALAQEIWAGTRRPRGHLLAQSLAAHVGLPDAPQLSGLRIVRIAVHPAIRRRGLGRQLLRAVRDFALQQGCDYLGTSFGVSEALLQFWLDNGLQPVRFGLSTGTSSGEHPLLMLSPISPRGEQMAAEARARFSRQLPALLSDPLRELPADTAAALLLASGPPAGIALTKEDWIDLAGFAYRQRGYETSLPAIERLALLGLGCDTLPAWERRLLVLRVLQKRPWADCARYAGLSGRAETERRLRQVMAELFRRFGGETGLALGRRFSIET